MDYELALNSILICENLSRFVVIPCTEVFEFAIDCEWSNVQTMIIELGIALPLAGFVARYFFKRERKETEPTEKDVSELKSITAELLDAISKQQKILEKEEKFRNERRRQNRHRIFEVIKNIVLAIVEIIEYGKDMHNPAAYTYDNNIQKIYDRRNQIQTLITSTLKNSKVIASDDFLLHEVENFAEIENFFNMAKDSFRNLNKNDIDPERLLNLRKFCSGLVDDFEKEFK